MNFGGASLARSWQAAIAEQVCALTPETQLAVEVHVWGIVQGVGFRPFVARLAADCGVAGSVRNEGAYVRVQVVANSAAIDRFLLRLVTDNPPASQVQGGRVAAVQVLNAPVTSVFRILPSVQTGARAALSIPPDLAICDDCLEDLRNPNSRYYRYPFTSCTQCGPRYTMVRRLPFDRDATTMSQFPLCPECEKEYHSPLSRRYHAQATACEECGSQLLWVTSEEAVRRATLGEAIENGRSGDGAKYALQQARDVLAAGGIVAVMGIGGFHLAVNAEDAAAVAQLRARKRRPSKPLALMMNKSSVAAYCEVSQAEWRQLNSRERPIVLLHTRADAGLPDNVAPGMNRLGVFLPYTGIQVLLLDDDRYRCLVMTSGNVSGEPLAYTIADAFAKLSGIADGFLVHNREILRPVDDSVVRVDGSDLLLLRRSRGYVPGNLPLDREYAGASANWADLTALAVGGDVKNAFAILKEGKLWLSPYIGDLDNPSAFALFDRQIAWHQELLQAQPEWVVRDLHPNYHSSVYAGSLPLKQLTVQHHHAHMAACMLEHGLSEPTIGVILDGIGFGDDGQIWGGELLYGTCADYERIGHLLPLRWIGGDVATKEPWRMVLNYLFEGGLVAQDLEWAAQRLAIDDAVLSRYVSVLRSSYPGLQCTSAGRLFDVASALIVRQGTSSFEGELPMRLEALVDASCAGDYPFSVVMSKGRWELDVRVALQALVNDLRRGVHPPEAATKFHRGFARGLAQMATEAASRYGVRHIVTGGGVWQNSWLLRWFTEQVAKRGLTTVTPRQFPVNDGGLAVGQLAVLCARQR